MQKDNDLFDALPSVEFEDGVVLVEGGLRVILEYIGEGFQGDCSGEPQDEPLLRVRFDEIGEDGAWFEYEGSSYCTRLGARLPMEILDRCVAYIMEKFREHRERGQSIKRLGQAISWMTARWLEPGYEHQMMPP